ncbi:MAG TPA: hypothetical protein VFO65_01085, partial [Acidimicrobiales bacterium]|nr:hypothetical protein [Acidimicrobiales bacterium]
MSPPPTRPPAADGWDADLRLLLGEDAGELLAAVAGSAGGTLRRWRARQVDHRPDRFTMVQYRADVEWPDGTTSTETFAAAGGERMPTEGAAVFADGSTRVAVWRWPCDPSLPGLAEALDARKVASLLDDLGIGGGALQLRARSYRPGRRAVIEATGRRGRLFLKVVPPARAEALHRLHRSLAAGLPVPDSLGWTQSGVVVLDARPGQTLREVLRTSRQQPPPPEAIVALLDRLPGELANGPARRDLVSAAEHHAAVLGAIIPDARDRLDLVLDRVRTAAGPAPEGVQPVHGDLYEAQLLVDRGRIAG